VHSVSSGDTIQERPGLDVVYQEDEDSTGEKEGTEIQAIPKGLDLFSHHPSAQEVKNTWD
jgi:hypothetical protein